MEEFVGFSHALRAAGVPVTPDRTAVFLDAVDLLGATPAQVHAAGRATLCAGPEDLRRFDLAFEAWFGANAVPLRRAPKDTATAAPPVGGPGEYDDQPDPALGVASDAERLRHRDIAQLSASERHRLAALFAGLQPHAPTRRAGRHTRARRGELDLARTLAASRRRLGEPAELVHRVTRPRPRRVVLLIDVSGSMSGYADALLRLAHRIATTVPATEVFTIGTRVTRISTAMRITDPDRALAAAADAVPDWSGGTRLGESLTAFCRRRRDLARSAVVILVTDGWERGDPADLAEAMSGLHRLCRTLIWANPHRGKPGYQPAQRGTVAMLGHVDHFVAGHSIASFAQLLEVVADA